MVKKSTTKEKTTPELVQEMMQELMSTRTIKTLKGSHAMYQYDDEVGLYVPQAQENLETAIECRLNEQATGYVRREVIGKLQARTYVDADDFDNDSGIVHVNNGYLNMSTLEFETHSRQRLSLYKLPVDYDPDARCPKFSKFLSDILEPDYQKLIQQLLGFFLCPGYPYRRAFIFVGPTHTGKTTLMNTLIDFLGKDNTQSLSLQDICDHSFRVAGLYGSVANIHDELSAVGIKQFEMLKKLTGDSRITAEHKNKNPFQFWSRSKMVFACNEIPPASRADDAYYGRWVIVPLYRQFFEGAGAVKDYDKQLTTPDELSGILNLAVEGYRDITSNNGFAYPNSVRDLRMRYLAYSGDPIAQFVAECIQYDDPNEITPKQTIFEFYELFCSRVGKPAVDEISFYMRLTPYLDDSRIVECRPTEVNRLMSYRGLKVVLPKIVRPVERFKFTGVSLNPRDFTDD